MRVFVRLVIASSILAAFAEPTWAQENDDEMIAQGVYNKDNWPLETIHRPLTLAGGMLEIRGDTFRLGMSGGDVLDFAEPMVFAPEVYYGVSGQFTLGLTHTNHPIALGWPAAGFCVSGEENRCGKAYNAIGLEAQYALTRGGNLGLAVRGGLSSPRFDPDFALGITAGLTIRFKAGKVAVVLDPNLYIGAIARDEFPGMDGPADFLFLPAHIQYQLNTQTMFYLMSGLNAPFKNMGDFYQIPLGIGANFAVNNRADLGAEFRLENLAGKDIELAPDLEIGKFDERTFIARLAIRI